MSAQALVIEMYLAIERAEGRGSVDRARKAARAAGCGGFGNAEASAWLAPFVKAADGKRDGKRTAPGRAIKHDSDSIRTDSGRHDGLTRGKGIPSRNLEIPGTTSPPSPQSEIAPALFPEASPPSQPVKPKKGPRLISAYAGTTLESFGDLEPLVREVLAADGFGTETKAFRTALETLAMWRATYGEAAFGRGLEVAADKRLGHRYVGGVAKRFDPERDEPQRFDRGGYEPNESESLPTTADLIAAGVIPAPTEEETAAMVASRPAWFNAQLAAQA